MINHCTRGGFNVMMAVADPSFKLSTDSYYWSLLDKVNTENLTSHLGDLLVRDCPYN